MDYQSPVFFAACSLRQLLLGIADDRIRVFRPTHAMKSVKKLLVLVQVESVRLRGVRLGLMVSFLVSGCAAAYVPMPLPVAHPAHPAALEAPLPPPSRALLNNEQHSPASAMETLRQRPHTGHDARHGGHE